MAEVIKIRTNNKKTNSKSAAAHLIFPVDSCRFYWYRSAESAAPESTIPQVRSPALYSNGIFSDI